MKPRVTEISAGVYQISIFVPEINLQFNHFLVKDDEPLLFHTGYRKMFPLVREGVSRIIEPSRLRWVSFSHFESDECGALNEWLETAPHAEVVASLVGVLVNLNDFAIRPPRALSKDEVIQTGKYRFRYHSTAQLPHGWDAGVLFEETTRTLFCSDLFHHNGDAEPFTHDDILERVRQALTEIQAGPLANYLPYTPNTDGILQSLAALQPNTLALMHGSAYIGNGERALQQLAVAMKEKLGGESGRPAAAR
jgi:flavorubredoxin